MTYDDLLTIDQLTAQQITELTERAVRLSEHWNTGSTPRSLAGKRIGLIVDEGGWRNTTALDLGMQEMGASCAQIPVSLSGKETIQDLAKYLDNWFDLLAVRTPSLQKLTELADAARAPVVNLRTRSNHPFETLGDLSFVKRERGSFDDLMIVAVAPAGNILHSWLEAAKVLPISLVQISSPAFFMNETEYAGQNVRCTDDISEIYDADVVITDCWPNDDGAESLIGFQVTGAMLDRTDPACMFVPCPPVTRGQEVAADAMEHDRCVVYDAKMFLLHAQNAFIELALAS